MEKNYSVRTPLRHNGKRYQRGDTVEMPETDGQPLVLIGCLELSADTITGDGSGESLPPFDKTKKTAGGEPPEANSDEDIIHGIVETLYAVYGDGEKADKKPNVSDVEKWMERKDITAALRDAAWERYQASEDATNDAED